MSEGRGRWEKESGVVVGVAGRREAQLMTKSMAQPEPYLDSGS